MKHRPEYRTMNVMLSVESGEISRVSFEKDATVNFTSALENYSLPIERVSSTAGAMNRDSLVRKRNIDKIESTKTMAMHMNDSACVYSPCIDLK